MTEDIADLYSKLKIKDEVDSDIKSRQDELIETQKSLFETFEKRLDTNEEHIALLQSNDSEQDAKIVPWRMPTLSCRESTRKQPSRQTPLKNPPPPRNMTSRNSKPPLTTLSKAKVSLMRGLPRAWWSW